MPEPELTAEGYELWLLTYNAVLGGMCAGFVSWAGHKSGPVTDAQVDAMLIRMEAAARRAANRAHGQPEPPAADESWPGM
jgi:hypothetical protein